MRINSVCVYTYVYTDCENGYKLRKLKSLRRLNWAYTESLLEDFSSSPHPHPSQIEQIKPQIFVT